MISRLLINKLPLWRGQKKIGTNLAPNILEHMVRNIVNNKYPIKTNHIEDLKLNDIRGYNIKKHKTPYSTWNINHIRNINNNDYKEGDMILNLGGDHGITIGTLPPMLERYPNLKVIWIDAHADINSPETSDTGNFHGMPVYFISDLSDCEDNNIKLPLKNLQYYGVRDLDEAESNRIINNNIRNYVKDEIDNRSLDVVIDDIINDNELLDNPVHLSIDIDSIDPKYCPSTGTCVDNGLDIKDVTELCKRIKETGNLVSIDLVEFNPLIGNEEDVRKTTDTIYKILKSFL